MSQAKQQKFRPMSDFASKLASTEETDDQTRSAPMELEVARSALPESRVLASCPLPILMDANRQACPA